jgi:hypothetical protein
VEKRLKFLEIHSSTSDKKKYEQAPGTGNQTAWWLGFGDFERQGSSAALTIVIC